ncbi:RNA binding motif protein 12Ba [Centropristis striata]|uniref:RNA binding motif protein 12Ba n=1 Tax=Centropristis striata TaxID=184440 RepID=UPI0027DEC1F9|nr:RNA binding motif protein 12Ba [Centropristis striata]
MTIILRLQGLDVKAGTEDIRTFFEHLHIPEGGVYIVGGRLREAFIAFNTEEDAQLAMRSTGKSLKGSEVALHVSSMPELEQKLKSLLKRRKPFPTQLPVKKPQPSPDANVFPSNESPPEPYTENLPPPTAQPVDANAATLPQLLHPDIDNSQPSNVDSLDSSTAFLLGVCTVLQGLQSSLQSKNNDAVPRVEFHKADPRVVCNEMRARKDNLDSRPGYVRLFGMSASVTKEVICQFFKGLSVQEVIVNVDLGRSRGCLVKFANMQDANAALLFNQQSMGPVCVEVRGATEKMWTGAVQECEAAFDAGESVKPQQNPLKETANQEPKNTFAQRRKRRPVDQLPSKSSKKPRLDHDPTAAFSPLMEYTVMVKNLPKEMTKTEIKELFGCPNMAHNKVLHLLDVNSKRTDTAFLLFNSNEDYEYAMNLTGCHVGSDAIEVTSVTKKVMREMMENAHPRSLESCPKTDLMKGSARKRKLNPVKTSKEAPSVNFDPAAQTCLFVRNMPADVQRTDVKRLFSKFHQLMKIILLYNREGEGIGEAVLQFKSEKLAELAHRLHHGQDFLGTQVLLTRINVKQMEDILARNI